VPISLATARLSAALLGALLVAACLDWGRLQAGACGDGFVGREEACDDGNRTAGDGCSDDCRVEPPYCGDGRVEAGEDCDDANTLDGDACIACRDASCGDGFLWAVQEACDDGNEQAGDGCSSSCQIEPAPSGPRCGDGALDADEVCDDGNQSSSDSCANGCAWAACGDGLRREGVEECDDGNTDSASCSRGCLICGDEPNSYFRLATGHCYTLHAAAISQGDARAACQAEGGDLWTVTSQAEGRDVSGHLDLVVAERYWLGLVTTASGRSWLTGENSAYSNFAAGEPSKASVRCVSLQHDELGSSWSSQSCGDALGYVCERAPVLIYPGNHHAFRLYTGALPVEQARQTCREWGGYLAMLETDDERLFVARNVDLAAWVDAGDAAVENQFAWANGTPVEPSAYASGQPDDMASSQGCLFLNPGERLADAPCSDNRAYLCEHD
jgi:cysteine-rich repeat protein